VKRYENLFALREVFPDAKRTLTRKFNNLEESRKNCLVALDANVLLSPYRLDAVSIDAIRRIYRNLSKESRLLVPAHAAREFSKHRFSKIAELVQSVRNQSSSAKAPASKPIEYLKGNASFEAALRIASDIEIRIKEYRSEIDKVIDELSNWSGNKDPITAMYSDVIADCIVDLSLTEEQATEFLAEHKFRKDMKIPPGFADGAKPDEGIGDLIIWKTVLQAAKGCSRDLLFVTQEEKNDWFVVGGGTRQPRPELLDEYFRESNGGTLHLLSLPAFLRLFEAAPSVVEATETAAQEERLSLEIDEITEEGRLTEIQSQIDSLRDSLGSLAYDANESLSLPWNRAAYGLRQQLRILEEQAEFLKKKIVSK
jgi:hypothetical protein